MTDDETGAALATAFGAYVPNELETKILATWWLFLFAAHDTGAIDPVLLDSDLQRQLAALFEKYPTVFDSCTSSPGSLGSASQALIGAPEDFTCDASCIPSAAVVRETMNAIFDGIRQRATGPAGQLLNNLYDQATKLSRTLKNVTSMSTRMQMEGDRAASERAF